MYARIARFAPVLVALAALAPFAGIALREPLAGIATGLSLLSLVTYAATFSEVERARRRAIIVARLQD